MLGRLGWAEILVIVVLLVILFGHKSIPGMMKNLADGVNVFKRELKKSDKKDDKSENLSVKKTTVKSKRYKKVNNKKQK